MLTHLIFFFFDGATDAETAASAGGVKYQPTLRSRRR